VCHCVEKHCAKKITYLCIPVFLTIDSVVYSVNMIQPRGFTLIELLTVIAVIGLLAGVILVSTAGVRDDAKEAAVLSQMRSVQVAMVRCLNKNKVMYCRGGTGVLAPINCTGDRNYGAGGGPAYSVSTGAHLTRFADDAPFCGTKDSGGGDISFGVWPDITENDWVYGSYTGSDVSHGEFAFWAWKYVAGSDEDVTTRVVCCTQRGCTLEDKEIRLDDQGWPRDNFCRVEAGLTAED
jgi:prepilin-type N-terminal cleavage/methylation domain-containing protein